jgi:diacylglycerol O-acyltransferase
VSRFGVAMRGREAKDLYEDTPEQPKHTVKVLHLDPAHRLTIEQVQAHVQDRVVGLPILRRRARPAGLGHAWWEELPTLDVRAHVEVQALPPGSAARDQAVGALLARPLQRDRPLWRLTLLDAPDTQSLVLSASHALLDGVVAAHVLEALFGPEIEPQPDEAVRLPPRARELGRLAAQAPALGVRAVRAARRKRHCEDGRNAAKPFAGAGAAWNEPLLTAARGYAEATFELSEFLEVARAGDATFTELTIALVGGALRTVLIDGAGLPDRDLLAVVPMGVRRADEPVTAANLLTIMFVPSGALLDDAEERLRAVSRATRAAKARTAAGDPRLFADAWDLWPLVRLTHQVSRAVTRRMIGRPPAAVSVSTVRGPRTALLVAGAPVRSIVSGGVVLDDMGLNVTAWSSGRLVTFGVTGRPALVDVGDVAAGITQAFARHRHAVDAGSWPSGQPRFPTSSSS